MKRMSISEIEDTFSIINKREQIMYVGQGRWTIKNDGSFEYFDEGNGHCRWERQREIDSAETA